MIDIGINLTSKRFDKDRNLVIKSAAEHGVKTMLITGTNLSESQKAYVLTQQHDSLFSTAGVHPHDADNVNEHYLAELESLAKKSTVKAIGECGLDFNRNFSTPENQQRVFEQQLQLAQQCQLPVFLHQRDAFSTWQSILSPYLSSLPGGISHCFTGDLSQLKSCLDMGLYIGITGWICDDRRGQELYDIAKYIPLDRVMIETDAPYLTPRNIRPKPKSSRNEPKYLPYIAQTLAQAMAIDVEQLVMQTTKNAHTLFKFTGEEINE